MICRRRFHPTLSCLERNPRGQRRLPLVRLRAHPQTWGFYALRRRDEKRPRGAPPPLVEANGDWPSRDRGPCGNVAADATTVSLPGSLAVLSNPAPILGAIEGIADAVARFPKTAAGAIANRFGRRRV